VITGEVSATSMPIEVVVVELHWTLPDVTLSSILGEHFCLNIAFVDAANPDQSVNGFGDVFIELHRCLNWYPICNDE
jgi:hypothetical protein